MPMTHVSELEIGAENP